VGNINQEQPPLPGRYVAAVQGVFATGVPEIHERPHIREGVCGSALLRIGSQWQKRGGMKLSTEVVLERGEVTGFMHWTDLRPNTSDAGLWMYCETTDPLIEAGWEVRQMPEKRGREPTPEVKPEDESEEESGESPTKKGKKKA
jgi:hypothetical protein